MTPSLQIRSIQLRVTDLARSLDFYTRQLGFIVVRAEPGRVELATSANAPALLALSEDPAARPAPADTAGLFHAALLFPSRAALGRWLRRAADLGVPFDGFSDHGVSEAIYLQDPEGNGLEFYADRPHELWPTAADGQLTMFTRPLDLPGLLAAATPPQDPAAPPLAGAHWGHLHLRVVDLDRSQEFYNRTLGTTLMVRFGDSARFLAADGYHHHLGLNTWTRSRQPAAPHAPGLAEATYAHAHATHETHATDPDGLAVRIVPA